MPRGVYERDKQQTPITVDDTALAADEKVGGPVHRTVPTEVKDTAANQPFAGYTYMALKPMKVAGVKVNPGDIVDDAQNWRNVHNYLSAGYLTIVSGPTGDTRF